MSMSSSLKHAALPSMAGTLFQLLRFVMEMIEEWPSRIRFEVLDDFDIALKNLRAVEQDKLSLKAEPITDESEDIWKTLSNWIDVEKHIEESAETPIDWYRIATNSPDPGPDSLANALGRSDLTGDQKLDSLKLVFDRRAERQKRSVPTTSNAQPAAKKPEKPPYIERVMDAGHRTHLLSVLGKVSILFSVQATWDTGPKQTAWARRHLRLRADEDPWPVVAQLHHWVAARILERALGSRDVVITSEELSEQLFAILSKQMRPERAVRSRLRISQQEKDAAIPPARPEAEPLYQRRLRAIDANKLALDKANEDFILHLAEMRYQSHHGYIMTASSNIEFREDLQYYADLHDRWTTTRDKVCSQLEGDSPKQLARSGRDIYFSTLEHAAQAQLKIGTVSVRESYFSAGAYQVLANGHHEKYEVWWHPNDAQVGSEAPNSTAPAPTGLELGDAK